MAHRKTLPEEDLKEVVVVLHVCHKVSLRKKRLQCSNKAVNETVEGEGEDSFEWESERV